MRAFRIGFILTLSFFLVLSVVTLTFGYFPAPSGPKEPTYPSYEANPDTYQQQQNTYDAQEKQYQHDQKTFTQDKIVPYAQGVFVGWILCILLFQVLGMVFVRFLSVPVGAAYSFSGVWAVLFGPLGGLLWFVNSLVSSFASKSSDSFSADPIFQTVGVTAALSVLILTVGGIVFFTLHQAATTRPVPQPTAA